MASKNTRKKVQAEINDMPVTPVNIHFTWKLNPTGKYKGVTLYNGHLVSSLDKVIEGTITFTRLRGMAYDENFVELSSFVGREDLYEMEKVEVTTAFTEEPIKASWSTMTKSESLIGWMMQNATKLYLSAMDRKLGRPFQDRNFTELCGALISKDPTKVYGSASILKSVKSDIKDIKEVQKIADDRLYMESPLHSLRNSMINIEGMADELLSFRKEQKEKRLLKSSK